MLLWKEKILLLHYLSSVLELGQCYPSWIIIYRTVSVWSVISEVQGIGCFVCTSINGSNPRCEDPFNSYPDAYDDSCSAAKGGDRTGKFPATTCIKLKAYQGNIYYRKCNIQRCDVSLQPPFFQGFQLYNNGFDMWILPFRANWKVKLSQYWRLRLSFISQQILLFMQKTSCQIFFHSHHGSFSFYSIAQRIMSKTPITYLLRWKVLSIATGFSFHFM